MKLEAFATLNAVIRTGNFASAAVQMHLTPSAVSMQMKQLEQYLGLPLFDRSGRQIRVRASALDVAAAMRDGLERIQTLRLQPGLAVQGTVQLGMIESLLPAYLPGVFALLRACHPRLLLRPVRGRSASLIAAVKAGQLDAAVVALPSKGGSDRLRWCTLARRELMMVAPPDAAESNPAALLRRYDWIRYDRGTVTGALAARHVLSLIPNKRSTVELDSAPAIIAMVSGGLGVSIIHLLDTAVCRVYPVRQVRLGHHAPKLKLTLVSRKTSDDDRVLAAVRAALLSVLNAA